MRRNFFWHKTAFRSDHRSQISTESSAAAWRTQRTVLFSGGYRILQGRVSNPSERGTGGRAPNTPRGVGSGEGGCAPSPEKLLYFVYQNGEFLCIPCRNCFVFTTHPVQLTMFRKYVLFKKGTLITWAHVRTPWTPPGSAHAVYKQVNQCFMRYFV